MGVDVGRQISDAVNDGIEWVGDRVGLPSTPDDVSELIRDVFTGDYKSVIRMTVLPTVIANIWPVAQTAQMVFDLSFHNRELRWYHYLFLTAGPVGFMFFLGASYQMFREKVRRERNAAQNLEAELLAEDIQKLHVATAQAAAQIATGELRLFTSRIAVTAVGQATFVTDDKPAEWRIFEQLYNIRLISSEEYVRQNAANWTRPFGRSSDVIEEFVAAAKQYRARW